VNSKDTISRRSRLPSIIISGPTASGKSALALNLARKINGEIVNCDSVQVYKGCDIGSAKPSADDRQVVPHHLFDIFAPDEQCDAVRYRELALGVIDEIQSRAKIPIFVGSSGLYISALLEGIDPMPSSVGEVREALNQKTSEDLYAELRWVDPERAKVLKPTDRARIVRALEIWTVSGVPQSEWFRRGNLSRTAVREVPAIILIMYPERELLYSRINKRSGQMIQDGLIEETRSMVAEYGSTVAPMYAIGYREAGEFLARGANASELKLLLERIALVTRQYSKRQRTYWRNEPQKRGWEPMLSILNGRESVLQQPWLNILLERCRGVGNKVEVWYLYESLLENLEREHG